MKKINKSGITLIETILYLGIAVLVLGTLFSYGWNIIGTNVKAQVAMETSGAARIFGERLRYEIRRAESVDRSASAFDDTPAKLVLESGGEAVTIEDSGNDISIKRGSSDPVSLQAKNIRIENLIFSEQVSETDETEYVVFSFDAVADYSGSGTRSEYQYSVPVSSGSSLRK